MPEQDRTSAIFHMFAGYRSVSAEVKPGVTDATVSSGVNDGDLQSVSRRKPRQGESFEQLMQRRAGHTVEIDTKVQASIVFSVKGSRPNGDQAVTQETLVDRPVRPPASS
jgi:hypothetical protein